MADTDQFEQKPLAKVIISLNEKGGVGKTMFGMQLALELSERECHQKRVLVIDNDHQSHIRLNMIGNDDDVLRSEFAEFMAPVEGSSPNTGVSCAYNLYSELDDDASLDTFHAPPRLIYDNFPNLYLLAGCDRLSTVDTPPSSTYKEDHEESMVNNFYQNVDFLRELFDYIIIDNGPAFNIRYLCAMRCAEFGGILIPCEADPQSINGALNVISRSKLLAERGGCELPVLGVLINLWQENRASLADGYELAKKAFGPLLFNTRFKMSEHVRQAVSDQEWLGFKYPGRPSTRQLKDLTMEIIERLEA